MTAATVSHERGHVFAFGRKGQFLHHPHPIAQGEIVNPGRVEPQEQRALGGIAESHGVRGVGHVGSSRAVDGYPFGYGMGRSGAVKLPVGQ